MIALNKKTLLTILNVALIVFIAGSALWVYAQNFIFVSPPYGRNNNPVTVGGDLLNSVDNGLPSSGSWTKSSVPNNGAWYLMENATFSKADPTAQIVWQLYEWDGSAYTIAIGSPVTTNYAATAGTNYIFATAGGLQSGNPDWSAVASVDGQYIVKATVTP